MYSYYLLFINFDIKLNANVFDDYMKLSIRKNVSRLMFSFLGYFILQKILKCDECSKKLGTDCVEYKVQAHNIYVYIQWHPFLLVSKAVVPLIEKGGWVIGIC